ncbi:Peroxisomal biogenesis factor 19 [Tolypocladium capitatum]|uniref:Peroxisomal biogenesis factor 19 n=1 Tax=Tolypocladium capitatum TaxID=45235 RepID=A0A2K3QFS8_9HYPO|nr:Peroxisomal biogenesis factor 19 [Tolypocladium capitatum]
MDANPGAPAGSNKDGAEAKGAEVSNAPPTSASEPAEPAEVVEDVPDPDEDDLDDLDDMLGEFSAVKLDATTSPKPAEPTPSSPAASSAKSPAPPPPTAESQTKPEDAFSEEEFAKQLQAGMADLIGELEKSASQAHDGWDSSEFALTTLNSPRCRSTAGTEDLEPGHSAKTPSPAKSPPANNAADAADATFQDTIRRTMERMQTSGEQATAAAASGGGDDFMSEMLKQLSSGDFNPEGSEEEFSKMLMGMMEQLTNKDILYEPMKELDDKFPEWFEKNKDSTPPEDLKRYEHQKALVKEIVAKFEESSYSDNNAADREYIVDRMQKMQAVGSPPEDLVGDMASAQDVFNGADDQCNPQ